MHFIFLPIAVLSGVFAPTVHMVPDTIRMKWLRLDLRPFSHRVFPWLMILRLFHQYWQFAFPGYIDRSAPGLDTCYSMAAPNDIINDSFSLTLFLVFPPILRRTSAYENHNLYVILCVCEMVWWERNFKNSPFNMQRKLLFWASKILCPTHVHWTCYVCRMFVELVCVACLLNLLCVSHACWTCYVCRMFVELVMCVACLLNLLCVSHVCWTCYVCRMFFELVICVACLLNLLCVSHVCWTGWKRRKYEKNEKYAFLWKHVRWVTRIFDLHFVLKWWCKVNLLT
jgi:hypothetical protein